MRGLRLVPIVLVSAALVVACGSSGSPTESPGGGGGGGNPTATPAGGGGGGGGETQAPGGGGGGGSKPAGWDSYGKVTYSVSGAESARGELGFQPMGSVFAGQQVSLSFFDDASQTLVALRFDGSTAYAQYGDGKLTFVSDECTTSNLNLQPTSAGGSFDCTGSIIPVSGAVVTGGKMTGTFSARAT